MILFFFLKNEIYENFYFKKKINIPIIKNLIKQNKIKQNGT
jgi:hypothetical protein